MRGRGEAVTALLMLIPTRRVVVANRVAPGDPLEEAIAYPHRLIMLPRPELKLCFGGSK